MTQPMQQRQAVDTGGPREHGSHDIDRFLRTRGELAQLLELRHRARIGNDVSERRCSARSSRRLWTRDFSGAVRSRVREEVRTSDAVAHGLCKAYKRLGNRYRRCFRVCSRIPTTLAYVLDP